MSDWQDIPPREPSPIWPDYIKHVSKDGARYHVLSWSGLGTHCSEKDCEVNRWKGGRSHGGKGVPLGPDAAAKAGLRMTPTKPSPTEKVDPRARLLEYLDGLLVVCDAVLPVVMRTTVFTFAPAVLRAYRDEIERHTNFGARDCDYCCEDWPCPSGGRRAGPRHWSRAGASSAVRREYYVRGLEWQIYRYDRLRSLEPLLGDQA